MQSDSAGLERPNPSYVWATDSDLAFGNAFGYTRANRALRAALADAGGCPREGGQIAVHFMYPLHYRPLPDRFNALFTMFENPCVPPWFVDAFARAEALIVPAPYVRDIFAPCTNRPIYEVPLGYCPETFPGISRDNPKESGRPWRWLWIGAHNLRKGWREIMDAWTNGGFLNRADCELYLKTTGFDQKLYRVGNIIFDTRAVTDLELLRIYANADSFVFPSMGEGFGLTLLEAMGTALPCVATIHTGMAAFADESCVDPVEFSQVEMLLDAHDRAPGGDPSLAQKMAEEPWPAPCQVAKVKDLIRKMRRLMVDWNRARRLGERACDRAASFTWAKAGVKLLGVLGEIESQHVVGRRLGDAAS